MIICKFSKKYLIKKRKRDVAKKKGIRYDFKHLFCTYFYKIMLFLLISVYVWLFKNNLE